MFPVTPKPAASFCADNLHRQIVFCCHPPFVLRSAPSPAPGHGSPCPPQVLPSPILSGWSPGARLTAIPPGPSTLAPLGTPALVSEY
jgi:hypothetical protein